MSIYRNSRYTKTKLYYRGDERVITFKNRDRFTFNLTDCTIRVFQQGDTLYNLAYEYYNSTQLWWVILDANPNYRWEGDINYGDELSIPSYEEVFKCLQR
jgi:phage tail protein X